MKVFISQKMRDLSEEEIVKRRQMIIDLVSGDYEKVEAIESWHPDFDKNSVAQLGRSIIEMSEADLVMLSDISIENIEDFMETGKVKKFKGSEFEALICASYNIETRMYTFNLDEKGLATGIEWA